MVPLKYPKFSYIMNARLTYQSANITFRLDYCCQMYELSSVGA